MSKKKQKEIEKAVNKATRETVLEDFQEWARPTIDKINKLDEKIKNTKTLKIGIIIHDEPDPDAISAALGLKTIFQKLGRDPERIEIFADNTDYVALGTKTLINAVNVVIKPLSKFNPKKHKPVLVDIGSIHQSNLSLKKDAEPELIIDHHNTESPFEASATIITLLMTIMEFKISKLLATALHLGIDTDTNDGTSEKFTDFDELAYFKILPPLIDNKIRVKIKLPDPSKKQFEMLANALTKYCVVQEDSLIITGVGYIDETSKGAMAIIANELLKFARKVFVIGIVEIKSEDKKTGTILHKKFAVLSVRSKTGTENAGAISVKIFGHKVAGGDPVKAGGKVSLDPSLIKLIEQAKEDKDQEKLERYFQDILNLYKREILEKQTK